VSVAPGIAAERGPQAVDPTPDDVDDGRAREPITERQRKAVLRLNRVEREPGADGSVLCTMSRSGAPSNGEAWLGPT
jgi:hypothetical protein